MRFTNERRSSRRSQLGGHPAVTIADDPDPFSVLAALMARPEMAHRLLLGVTSSDWNLSAPRRNVAFVGAPRGNKSASAVTAVAAHPGPVVVVTTRRTEFSQAVGILRARMAGPAGGLMHLGVDGSDAPPGLVSKGWSPVSKTWGRAYRVAGAMTEAMSLGTATTAGSFWETSATSVLAPFLYAAGLQDLVVHWVVTQVKRQETTDAVRILKPIAEGGDRGAQQAVADLTKMDTLAPETKGGIWATAAAALAPYSTEEALTTTERPLLDVEAFCAGRPTEPNPHLRGLGSIVDANNPTEGAPLGCWDTLFITASSLEQRLLAPLIVGVLTDLRVARFRHEGGADLLVVLDDMPALAPDRDLPGTLAQSGGQGLLVFGIYHDDAQLRAKWGDEGDNMATTFGEQIVFRGVRDTRTLERFSTLVGSHFTTLQSTTLGRTSGGRLATLAGSVSPTEQYSESTSQQLVPLLPPHMINQGHPGADGTFTDDTILSFHPNGWEWAYVLPYYSSPLMLKAIVTSMGFMVEHHDRQKVPLPPPPELAAGNDYGYLSGAGGIELIAAYQAHRKVLTADDDPPTSEGSLVPA